MKRILYCGICGKYTMKPECPECKGKTYEKKPAKYSPQDKWGKYRRAGKMPGTQKE